MMRKQRTPPAIGAEIAETAPLATDGSEISALEAEAAERRRSRRLDAYGTFVAIEAPSVSEDFCWSSKLIDINGDGMALTLPPELTPGVELFLTFGLDKEAHLNRVPAVVRRQEEGTGAVRFEAWPEVDRLKLLRYLLGD